MRSVLTFSASAFFLISCRIKFHFEVFFCLSIFQACPAKQLLYSWINRPFQWANLCSGRAFIYITEKSTDARLKQCSSMIVIYHVYSVLHGLVPSMMKNALWLVPWVLRISSYGTAKEGRSIISYSSLLFEPSTNGKYKHLALTSNAWMWSTSSCQYARLIPL